MPVRRSDSLRSADSSQRRVSFNRAVHVKRIPRGQAPPAPALVVDEEGRLQPLPVRREKAPRSALELAREARKVLQQAERVNCTASSPSGVPIRPSRRSKTPPADEEYRSKTLPHRRAHRGRIQVDVGNSSSTSGGESSLERKGRIKSRQNKQLSPIIETGSKNTSYNSLIRDPLEYFDHNNTQSDSATMLHSRHKSPPISSSISSNHHQQQYQQQQQPQISSGPRRSVNVLVRQLQKDCEQSHLNTRVSPPVLHTPDNEICHNNNRPFSYIKPPLENNTGGGNEVIYAQVVVSGQGAGANKQTVHTSIQKPPPSDEDEGLEIDSAYRPRQTYTNGYNNVNLRNERNISSSRLIDGSSNNYEKDNIIRDSRLNTKSLKGAYNNSNSSSNNNGYNIKKKDLCIDSDSSYNTKQRDLFDSGIENDNPPASRHQQENSKIETDGLTAKIVVNGGYNNSRNQASTNVTRVNLNGRRIAEDASRNTLSNNGRNSSNTTERYYYSGEKQRSKSPAMNSARLVQQATDRNRDLPASSVLIRHWAGTESSEKSRTNGNTSTYQRKPRRRLEMEEDTDQDSQRNRREDKHSSNKIIVEKETSKKKRKLKMKNPFSRDKKSPVLQNEDVSSRYAEYKGSNLHLKRTGSDSSRETPASHGPSDTDQGPWDEVDAEYDRHRVLERTTSNTLHRQQQRSSNMGPPPVVRKSSGESAGSSSLARSEPAINTRASKSSGGAASWFKSLDRLTFRTNKANKAATNTKKKEEVKNQKNLRFFGDTDQESVISHVPPVQAPQRQYRSNQNSRYQTSVGGRSSSSGARRGVQLRQSRQSASPNSSEDSENATTEGDSSLQSQRSVFLHAAAIGDIPGPGGPRRAISREELSSTGGARLQPQTRHLSRSISVLAPWRPRHYRNDAPEIHYDNESSTTQRTNSTKPPRAPRNKMSAASVESLNQGSGSSPERGRSASRHRTSNKAPAPQPPGHKSGGSRLHHQQQQQQQSHRTAVSRSASMPKDSRLAGWFRRKKLGSKEANTNNL